MVKQQSFQTPDKVSEQSSIISVDEEQTRILKLKIIQDI